VAASARARRLAKEKEQAASEKGNVTPQRLTKAATTDREPSKKPDRFKPLERAAIVAQTDQHIAQAAAKLPPNLRSSRELVAKGLPDKVRQVPDVPRIVTQDNRKPLKAVQLLPEAALTEHIARHATAPLQGKISPNQIKAAQPHGNKNQEHEATSVVRARVAKKSSLLLSTHKSSPPDAEPKPRYPRIIPPKKPELLPALGTEVYRPLVAITHLQQSMSLDTPELRMVPELELEPAKTLEEAPLDLASLLAELGGIEGLLIEPAGNQLAANPVEAVDLPNPFTLDGGMLVPETPPVLQEQALEAGPLPSAEDEGAMAVDLRLKRVLTPVESFALFQEPAAPASIMPVSENEAAVQNLGESDDDDTALLEQASFLEVVKPHKADPVTRTVERYIQHLLAPEISYERAPDNLELTDTMDDEGTHEYKTAALPMLRKKFAGMIRQELSPRLGIGRYALLLSIA
jgi:hypothetical protein